MNPVPEFAEALERRPSEASSVELPSARAEPSNGETFYNANSGALSSSLKRVSSSGTETSNGSGTEWFEAADYESDSFGHSSAGHLPDLGEEDADEDGDANDDDSNRSLVILVIQGPSGGHEQAAVVKLLLHEVGEGCMSSIEGRALVLRIFTEVRFLQSYCLGTFLLTVIKEYKVAWHIA